MKLTRTIAPDDKPITIHELRAHLRIDDDMIDDEAILFSYLTAAVESLDGKKGCLGRALITQTWEGRMDAFPTGEMDIPLPPLQSVSSIQYIDTDGVTQTFASSDYHVDIYAEPGRVVLAENASWPDTDDRPNAVTVTFVAGYGDYLASTPEALRVAILNLAAHYYEIRTENIIGTSVARVPEHIDRLIAPYVLPAFAAA